MAGPCEPIGFCPACGYRMDAGTCPECGRIVERPAAAPPRFQATAKLLAGLGLMVALYGLLLLVLFTAMFIAGLYSRLFPSGND